jgi:hypothetical protein
LVPDLLSIIGAHRNLMIHGSFNNWKSPIDSSEYFSCLIMTGTTVEKKLIGIDWAI